MSPIASAATSQYTECMQILCTPFDNYNGLGFWDRIVLSADSNLPASFEMNATLFQVRKWDSGTHLSPLS